MKRMLQFGVAIFTVLCLLSALADRGLSADPVDARQAAVAKLEQRLGNVKNGYFLVALKQSKIATIQGNNPPPDNARRLPGNRWMEIVYQVEMKEGRWATADYLVGFLEYVQKQPRDSGSTYDWRMIGHFDKHEEAAAAFKKAQEASLRKCVTLRQLTPENTRVYHGDGEPFFRRPK